MDKEQLKKLCLEMIDSHKEEIIKLGEQIYKTPELGYKEFRTTETMRQAFSQLSDTVETEIAYTGCKISANPASDGPCVAVIGELDSVTCAQHPAANELGNVHACGHNVQLANLYGCAIGILKSGVYKELAGKVEFIAIPAEECVDFQYREELTKAGKIKYLGGKQEYLHRGGFDKVDMVLQNHVIPMKDKDRCIVDTFANGFISKTVKFLGCAAHAGASPENGINALNMAELAMNNIHALRETFRDEDKIRVSMIITEGGELVNVVPAQVVMEIMVRASTVEAMESSSEKVNRALKAAAYTLGGKVEIKEAIGYLPLKTMPQLSQLYKQNLLQYGNVSADCFVERFETAGSTDLGDISQLMPCMHIWSGGVSGGLHTKDYEMTDAEEAYILPAKMLALTVIDLLYDNADNAKEILTSYEPNFTKEEYFALLQKYTKVDLFNGVL